MGLDAPGFLREFVEAFGLVDDDLGRFRGVDVAATDVVRVPLDDRDVRPDVMSENPVHDGEARAQVLGPLALGVEALGYLSLAGVVGPDHDSTDRAVGPDVVDDVGKIGDVSPLGLLRDRDEDADGPRRKDAQETPAAHAERRPVDRPDQEEGSDDEQRQR